ncbi:MAG: DUF357 domain-containing protein [Candidatus Nanoarchaeia archaeon]
MKAKNLVNNAKKEIERMESVFKELKIISKNKKALEFYDFAKRYFEDGKWFYKKRKYLEAFEAEIISWAYIDVGLKLKFFKISNALKFNFTSD